MTEPVDDRMLQKEAVRKAFSRAAKTYDQHAEVQAEVEARFLARVESRFAGLPDPSRILEIGCGTGRGAAALLELFPRSTLLALDFCPEMIACAQRRWSATESLLGRVEGRAVDAESFAPEVGDRFGLVASSGVFQWFADLQSFFARTAGWLAPSGELHFALFGARTFYELNETLSALERPAASREAEVPAARFAIRSSISRWLAESFTDSNVETVTLVREYPDLLSLLRNLHHTGTHGRQWRGSLSPGRLRRWEAAYRERFGAVLATYEIHFGAARGPR